MPDSRPIDDYGFTEHRDRKGKPCVYCGEPAVTTMVVAPSPGRGSPDIRAALCAAHRRKPEPPLPKNLGVATDVEHLTLDVGDA